MAYSPLMKTEFPKLSFHPASLAVSLTSEKLVPIAVCSQTWNSASPVMGIFTNGRSGALLLIINIPEVEPGVKGVKVKVMSCVAPGATMNDVSDIVKILLRVDVISTTLRGALPVLLIETVNVVAPAT